MFAIARDEWHWISENPCSKVSRPKENPSRKRRVSADELERLYLASGQDIKQVGARVVMAFEFCIETACRGGEALRISADSIRKHAVHLPMTKNGDARDVPLSARAEEILDVFSRQPKICCNVVECPHGALIKHDGRVLKCFANHSLSVLRLAALSVGSSVALIFRAITCPPNLSPVEPMLNSAPLGLKRKAVAGSLIGGIAETQEMLDFCGQHGITSDVEMIPIQAAHAELLIERGHVVHLASTGVREADIDAPAMSVLTRLCAPFMRLSQAPVMPSAREYRWIRVRRRDVAYCDSLPHEIVLADRIASVHRVFSRGPTRHRRLSIHVDGRKMVH